MRSPEPEVILELAKELKETRDRLAILQAKWDGFFAPQGNADLPFPKKGGRRPMSNSVTGKILAKLAEDPTKDFSKDDMAQALNIDMKQAERTLIKQFATGKISKAGRGRYCAKRTEIAA